jgi:hypothetical protein
VLCKGIISVAPSLRLSRESLFFINSNTHYPRIKNHLRPSIYEFETPDNVPTCYSVLKEQRLPQEDIWLKYSFSPDLLQIKSGNEWKTNHWNAPAIQLSKTQAFNIWYIEINAYILAGRILEIIEAGPYKP